MTTDLRHLLRGLRKSPASAIAAILSLSLTLGAGAALFALLDVVLLTPMPFRDPARLVTIAERAIDDPAAAARAVTANTVREWRERSAPHLTAIAYADPTNLTLTGLGAPVRIGGNFVSTEYFALLGVTAFMGRTFEVRDLDDRVAVIAHRFWRTRLESRPDAIGREIVLAGQPHTIIGVLPDKYAFGLGGSEVWLPLVIDGDGANVRRLRVIARLAPETTIGTAAEVLSAVSLASTPPSRADVVPLATALTARSAETVPLLMGAAVVAIALAVANLAAILLVRAIDRRRELAVRTALGASRWQVLAQLLAEAHVLVAAGTIGGLIVATWTVPFVDRLAVQRLGDELTRPLSLDWRVTAAVIASALACAWMCALAPAMAAARERAGDVLTRGATTSAKGVRVRRALVIGEIAAAFVLLSSVALVGGSLGRMLAVQPGFDPTGVFVTQLALPAGTYRDNAAVATFYRELDARLADRFGRTNVALIDELPLTGDRGRGVVTRQGADVTVDAIIRTAGTAYFDVLKIALRSGRTFEPQDDASQPRRVVLSQSLSDRLWPHGNAIGQRVTIAGLKRDAEVIGVVGDVHQGGLDEPIVPTVYFGALQLPSRGNHVVIASSRPRDDVWTMVRQEVAVLDRELPIYGATTMTDVVNRSPGVPTRRLVSISYAGFGLLAIVVAAIGLFGVMAHDVASRRSELALRVALGADPGWLMRAVLTRAGMLVAPGIVVGIMLTAAVSRALRNLLFGVSPYDPVSLAAVAATLSVVAIIAALPPARRAARTDAMAVLRSE